MFNAGDKVEIIACADDPRAIGRTGVIVDEIPPVPGDLTQGRWTVHRIAWHIAPVLCETGELRKVG